MGDQTLETAYVIHTRRYGDTSLIVELFTRERGRVACVAKGALKAKRGGSALQPLRCVSARISGRGEIGTLTQVEQAAPPVSLSGRRLYCGFYINELVSRLTARDDPHPALFDAYAQTLSALGHDGPVEPWLRRFELRLLREIGVGMTLDVDVEGRPIDPAAFYAYETLVGARRVDQVDDSAVRGSTLLALGGEDLGDDPDVLREARRLMRRVMDHHLDGKPLRSRELFNS